MARRDEEISLLIEGSGKRSVIWDSLQFLIFSAALLLILLFTVWIFYFSPLATVSVDDVNSTGFAFGKEISIYGEITDVSGSSFSLIDTSTNSMIQAAWIGDGAFSLFGEPIIAHGTLIGGQNGPVLVCDKIIPASEDTIVFNDPWALPALTLVSATLLWFMINIAVTGGASILYLLRMGVRMESFVRSLEGVTLLSGVVFFSLLSVFAIAEPNFGITTDIPFFALLSAVIILVASIVVRQIREPVIAEIALSLPILALLILFSGLLIIVVQPLVVPGNIVSTIMGLTVPDSSMAMALGTFGLLLLGAALSARAYYNISSAIVISSAEKKEAG